MQLPSTYDENAILDALLTALAASAPSGLRYVLTSRRVQLLSKVSSDLCPALFLLNNEDATVNLGEGAPPEITMDCKVLIYTNVPVQDDPPPSTYLNHLIKGVRDMLQPDAVLGTYILKSANGTRLASHCWIEGKTIKVPGDTEGRGLAVIPIRILVPYWVADP